MTVRLDAYLQEEISKKYGVKLSRSYIERILERGGVVLNGEAVKRKGFKLNPEKHVPELKKEIIEDTISIYQTGKRHNTEADQWDSSEMGIDIDEVRVSSADDIRKYIIYEDEDIVAVNKPSGVSSHPGKGDKGGDSMVYQFIKYMRSAHKYVPRAGLLHRLDKDTSGVLLFAKNMEVYNDVKAQFETRSIEKYYIAECNVTHRLNNAIKRYISENRIQPKPSNFTKYTEEYIDEILETKRPLEIKGSIARKRGSTAMIFTPDMRVARSLNNAKDCISDIFVLNADDEHISLLFVPHTGRTHQIRAQAQFLGCPVKNDRIYGASFTQRGILGLTAKGVRVTVRGKRLSLFI